MRKSNQFEFHNETLAQSQSAFPSLHNQKGAVRPSQVNEMEDIHIGTVRVAIWFGKKQNLGNRN